MKKDPSFDAYKELFETEKTPLPESLGETAVVNMLEKAQPKQDKKKIKVFPRVAAAAAAVAVVAASVWLIPWQRTVHTKPAAPQTDTTEEVSYTPLSVSGKPAALSQFDSQADLKAYFKNIAAKRTADNRMDVVFNSLRTGRSKDYAVVEDSAAGVAAEVGAAASATQTTGNYGKTNTRTENVDEGDVVKNDGRWLYTASGGRFSIIDTQTMQCVYQGEPQPEKKNRSYSFSSLYVLGDRLIVGGTLFDTPDYDPYWKGMRDSIYPYYGSNMCAVTLVYDIADRSRPALLRAAVQDGSVESSRMVGDMLYTVTTHNVWPDSDEKKSYVPAVNGEDIPCDRIYVRDPKEDCTSYIVLTALDTAHPETKVETLSLLGSSDCIYCTTDTLYVLSRNWSDDGMARSTEIYSFSLNGTALALKASGTVPGFVDDQFAVDQYKGFLRVTTTDYDYRTDLDVSALYVLDGELQIIGALKDFAHDEQVKSTRFLGDLAYVVTFRNTDPLFAVDLSDPSKPTILGEVKLPGFSEYLHPVSDKLLLGVGYSGDESSANFSTVKLSLFDISDPTKPKEVDTHVIKDAQSGVNFDPKAFVFDSERGVFGLPVTYELYDEDYGWRGTNYVYKTFAVKNGKFTDAKAYLSGSSGNFGYNLFFRGTYIGDKVYTLTENTVLEFDMASCEKLRTLVYDEPEMQDDGDVIVYDEETSIADDELEVFATTSAPEGVTAAAQAADSASSDLWEEKKADLNENGNVTAVITAD